MVRRGFIRLWTSGPPLVEQHEALRAAGVTHDMMTVQDQSAPGPGVGALIAMLAPGDELVVPVASVLATKRGEIVRFLAAIRERGAYLHDAGVRAAVLTPTDDVAFFERAKAQLNARRMMLARSSSGYRPRGTKALAISEEAMLKLWTSPERPMIADIADLAGVTPKTIYNRYNHIPRYDAKLDTKAAPEQGDKPGPKIKPSTK